MRRYLVLFFFFVTLFSNGQRVLTRGEWFEGSDPGVGNGQSFSLAAGSTISETVSISTMGMPAGFHTIYIRLQDNLGSWSHYASTSFYVLPPVISSGVIPNLVSGEWFIGSDPGVGNGTAFSLTNGTSFGGVIDLSTVGLAAGFHQLYLRVKDELGRWSHCESVSFYVLPPAPNLGIAPNLVSGEWFMGSDPGVGNGTAFSLTSGTSFGGVIDLSTVGLTAGFHQLYVRVKDELGRWSHYESVSFYILPPTPNSGIAPNLVSGEWFMGSDPGVGNGTAFSLTSGTSFGGVIDLSTVGLTAGFHQLYVRVKDALGRWSHYERASFYVLPPSATSFTVPLVGLEWFLGTDPGVGNGTYVALPHQVNLSNYSLPIDVAGIPDGDHTLYIRVKDSLGRWSHYESKDIFICGDLIGMPTVSGVQTYCQGEKIVLNGMPVSGSDQFFWRGPNGYNVEGLGVVRTNATPDMSGVYQFYVVSAGGYHCDTNFVSVNVTVHPTSHTQQSVEICAGTSYSVGTHVYTSTGSYTDTLVNQYHCDSIVTTNLIVLPNYTVSESVKKCMGEHYTLGTTTYTNSGIYTTVLTAMTGCDSTVITELIIGDPILNTQVLFENGGLKVVEEDATYQWIDCDLGTDISGAIFQTYTPTVIGKYAVVLTSTLCDGFVDTSACLNIYNVHVNYVDEVLGLSIYPNPAQSEITVTSTTALLRSLSLYDLQGKLLSTTRLSSLSTQLSVEGLSEGVYLLHVSTDAGLLVYKVFKKD